MDIGHRYLLAHSLTVLVIILSKVSLTWLSIWPRFTFSRFEPFKRSRNGTETGQNKYERATAIAQDSLIERGADRQTDRQSARRSELWMDSHFPASPTDPEQFYEYSESCFNVSSVMATISFDYADSTMASSTSYTRTDWKNSHFSSWKHSWELLSLLISHPTWRSELIYANCRGSTPHTCSGVLSNNNRNCNYENIPKKSPHHDYIEARKRSLRV